MHNKIPGVRVLTTTCWYRNSSLTWPWTVCCKHFQIQIPYLNMTRKFHCRAFCFTGSMHWEFRVLAGEIRHILAGEIKWISTHMLHGKDACQRCVNFLHWFRDNGDPYDLGIPYKIVVTSHLLTMLYENRMLCLWFETHLMKIWSFVCDQNPLSALSHSHPWFISIRLTETKCCYYDMLTHLLSYRDGGDPTDTTSIVPFSGLKT